jgi:hypothetical protein
MKTIKEYHDSQINNTENIDLFEWFTNDIQEQAKAMMEQEDYVQMLEDSGLEALLVQCVLHLGDASLATEGLVKAGGHVDLNKLDLSCAVFAHLFKLYSKSNEK